MSDETLSQVPESEAPQEELATGEPTAESAPPEIEGPVLEPAEDMAAAAAAEKTTAGEEPKQMPGAPPPKQPARLGGEEISDNDRVMAALAYFLWFIGPAIILLSRDMNRKPYLHYHAIQALGLNTVLAVASFVLAVLASISCCIGVLLLVPFGVTVYYTVEAYQAKYFRIPILTTLMVAEGWLKQP